MDSSNNVLLQTALHGSVDQSILALIRDPDRYPELETLNSVYRSVNVFRDWQFGRNAPPRLPQRADLPSSFLMEDCSNLGLVLNGIRPGMKKTLIDALTMLYAGIDDFNIQVFAGHVQLFLEEGDYNVPATRLSDGTLRFLCLLAILCHPSPPSIVCIEEPELGLHPDVIPGLAQLLIQASSRCQLIVTTHSEILVDELSETPESVIVCEKEQGATTMRRLDGDRLKVWLEKYSLGDLWLRGHIGGNR
jgi:predicted ATPase